MIKNPQALMMDDELREIARKLFVDLDLPRVFTSDYTNTLKVFREIYEAGRTRGIYESRSH